MDYRISKHFLIFLYNLVNLFTAQNRLKLRPQLPTGNMVQNVQSLSTKYFLHHIWSCRNHPFIRVKLQFIVSRKNGERIKKLFAYAFHSKKKAAIYTHTAGRGKTLDIVFSSLFYTCVINRKYNSTL